MVKPRYLKLLTSMAALMAACAPSPWTPPDEEVRNRAFVDCLRGQLESCGIDSIPLGSCTPFDWDEVFVADRAALSWAESRWKESHAGIVKAIRDRPDARTIDAGDSAFFFFDGGLVVDVLRVPHEEIDTRGLAGAVLTPGEAVFSNRAPLGVYGQPVVVPFFEASQTLREEFLVWHVSRRVVHDPLTRNFCVPDRIAGLIPRIEHEIRASGRAAPLPRVFRYSECRMPSTASETVTVAASGETAVRLSVAEPVFFSEGKVKIDYGSFTASLSSFAASSVHVRTDEGWRAQQSYVKQVS